ncbi:unnamed protein product [Chondrus crispus]|uniref:Uncharacterized protein n=1 Tax=Chondrus crispus TaxID=2769 RepID=R7QDC8_CHOCR|nr:unnamed protein product [Chondrus crispus]CDF36492.1 unnamed protein product [Chondrus crispus]|eukprot:XP_005716311.1 unnamed protein product [Chondrus crispus]
MFYKLGQLRYKRIQKLGQEHLRRHDGSIILRDNRIGKAFHPWHKQPSGSLETFSLVNTIRKANYVLAIPHHQDKLLRRKPRDKPVLPPRHQSRTHAHIASVPSK